MSDNVVISGIGIYSTLGIGIEDHLKALKCVEPQNINSKESNFTDKVKSIYSIDVKKYIKNKKAVRFFSKQTKLGCVCAKLARDDAKLDDEYIKKNERMNALILGSGHTQSLLPMKDALLPCIDEKDYSIDYDQLGNSGYRMLPPLWILSRLPNTTAGQISIENGIKGLNYTVVNGVNSGIISIGEAFLCIKQERAVRVFCGGIEDDIYPDFLYELEKDDLVSHSREECNVFGKESSGYKFNEGGAVFIVEKEEEAKKRNVDIYGEVIGYSNYYIPNMRELKNEEEVAKHLEKAMKNAMKMADVEVEDVDFIEASAGGYKILDYAEAIAIKNIFSDTVFVTENQSYLGNTLAASGAISVAMGCLQLKNNFIVPISEKNNVFLEDKLKYVKDKCISNKNNICLINSFSYLGEICTLVLRKR